MRLSVVAAVLAPSAPSLAARQCLDPACRVRHEARLHFSLSLQMLEYKVLPQVSTVWKDHSHPLQGQVCLEASVLWVITVLRAVAYPHPVQPALTKTRLEAKANMTVNHVFPVRTRYKRNYAARMMSSGVSRVLECLYQAGSRGL